jgi:hypothetical protein
VAQAQLFADLRQVLIVMFVGYLGNDTAGQASPDTIADDVDPLCIAVLAQ